MVDEPRSIVLFPPEVVLDNEHFDLTLDHCGLGFEHANAFHDVFDEVDVFHSTSINRALHPLHSLALDDQLSISLGSGVKATFCFIAQVDLFLRNQRQSDVLRLDIVVEGDRLIHVFE